MNFDIPRGEGKAVVDAGHGWHILGQPHRQPFRQTAPCPVQYLRGLGGGSISTGIDSWLAS